MCGLVWTPRLARARAAPTPQEPAAHPSLRQPASALFAIWAWTSAIAREKGAPRLHMPARFEVVPDVTADAALSLSDGLELGHGWMQRVQVGMHGVVRDAGALLRGAVEDLAGNLTNGTVNPSEWLSNRSEAMRNASAFASLASAHERVAPHAKAALLLAVFVWLFRELLVRSTTRSLLRRHGHAHQE